jgi:hypothetical protein
MTGSKYSFRMDGKGRKCTERWSASPDAAGGVVGSSAWYTISEVKGVNED